MSETSLATFGIAAAVLNVIGLIPYIRDVLRKKTKPERATWWVWLSLNSIALFAQIAVDVRWSLLLTISSIISVGTIAILSIPYGYGKFHKRDTISLIIAAIGIAVSFAVHSPLLALLVVIVVDMAGVWLTVAKTWVAPHTETLVAWAVACVSSALAVLAVGKFELALVLFAVYNLTANSVITLIIIYRRPKVKHDPTDF